MWNCLKKICKRLFRYKLKYPSNLDEALRALGKMLSKEDKIIIQLRTELEVCVHLHHSLGRHLRNTWGLWNPKCVLHKWFEAQGVWHPDDMSSIIIRSYYRKTKGRPIKLQEQIQEYTEYWAAEMNRRGVIQWNK